MPINIPPWLANLLLAGLGLILVCLTLAVVWYQAIRVKPEKLPRNVFWLDKYRMIDLRQPKVFNVAKAVEAERWTRLDTFATYLHGDMDNALVYYTADKVSELGVPWRDNRVKVISATDYRRALSEPGFEPLTLSVPVEFLT